MTNQPLHILFAHGEPIAVKRTPFELPEYGDRTGLTTGQYVPVGEARTAPLPPAQEPYGWAVFYDGYTGDDNVRYTEQWHVHIGSERPLDTYGEDAKFFPVYAAPQPASEPVGDGLPRVVSNKTDAQPTKYCTGMACGSLDECDYKYASTQHILDTRWEQVK